ncbi:Zinc finger, BED-type, partial [Parasponia andersonii]
QSSETLKSKVWSFFEIFPIGPDKVLKYACKKCGQQYLASSKYGIGNMTCHLKVCKRKDTSDVGQMFIQQDKDSMSLSIGRYDPEKFCELLISTIIMHDLPF